MVRAWYMDASNSDQRMPHMDDPPRFIVLEELLKSTGAEYFKLTNEPMNEDEMLLKLRKDRDYSYEDMVTISPDMTSYGEMIKKFFTEHIHSDQEIRLITKGSGYFDMRSPKDEWIRVEVVAGDMLILPAGIYHRFTTDTQNYIEVYRYFSGVPVWTPHNRPADEHPARQAYIKSLVAN